MGCAETGSLLTLVFFSWIVLQGLYYANCDYNCSCNDTNNCDFTNQCVPKSNCTKENVALGKQANMSSIWSGTGVPGLACVAVNGNTNTEYVDNTNPSPNCIYSGQSETHPWWSLDLGKNYPITTIRIYKARGYTDNLAYVKIYVDTEVCSTIYQVTQTPLTEEISCTSALTGRYIKIVRYDTRVSTHLTFCEVQVWVCIAGLFGPDCDERCGHCKEGPESCDRYSGICPSGCEDGFQTPTCKTECNPGSYGANCTEQCGHCINNIACNTVNGTCGAGCKGGFAGNLCKGCDEQHYGYNCSNQCGHCSGGICNNISGECTHGCLPGYWNTTCNQECNPGSYGVNCKEQCGHCLNNIACKTVNGTCEAGCKDGFAGILCKECDDGYYGPGCNYTCGTCTHGNICNKITGRCPNGCDRGWTTPYCNQSCLDGYFGSNCSFQCGNCFIGYCDKVDGFCPNGCKPGSIGTLCIQGAVTPEQSGNTVGPLVGAIIGGFVILGFIISATIVILRRRKSRSTDSTNTTKTNTVLQTPSNTFFSFKSSTQSETANEYDEIENHYDSLHPVDDSENHNYIPPAFEERIFKSTQQNHVYINDITNDSTDLNT